MRALVVLNEHPLGSHPDVYEAFSRLVGEGVLSGFDVVPYLSLLRQGWSSRRVSETIRDTVLNGGHQLLIWMHTGEFEVDDSILAAIADAPQGVDMRYWEGDAYDPLFKPIPNAALRVMRRCSTVFMSGGGPIVQTLRKAGVREVRYAPNCASETRFPKVWHPDEEHPLDIVVVGNRIASRVPFRTMPGARLRARLVRLMTAHYGRRVAVYGAGWNGAVARGPCPFDEQSRLYRAARVTVGVDNLAHEYFFSNRLPIALASGIPVLYRRNPGFQSVFPSDMQDLFFDDGDEMLTGLERLLGADTQLLSDLARRNREFFEGNLTRIAVSRFVVRNQQYHQTADAGPVHAPLWQYVPPLIGSR